MNSVQLCGNLATAPELSGNGILFMLKARYAIIGETTPAITLVPCRIFDYTQEQKDILLGSRHQKYRIEINGRIVRSVFENEHGDVVTSVEVVPNPSGLMLQRVR